MAKLDPSNPSPPPLPVVTSPTNATSFVSSVKPRRRDRIFKYWSGSKSNKQDTPPTTPESQSVGPKEPIAKAHPPGTATSLSDGSRSAPITSLNQGSIFPPSPVHPVANSQNVSNMAPKSGPKQTPTLITQASLDPTIFPENVSRTVKIQLPKIGHRIESTAQLVHCADLLRVMESPTFSASPSLSPESLRTIDGRPLRKEDLDWMRLVEKDKVVEKDRIQQLVVGTISEFISGPIKDLDAIREIVLVGPVLEKVHFRLLLACFLSSFDDAPILEVEKLQGVVQLVQDAPPGCLEVDDLIKILEIVRKRLESTSAQSSDFLFYLTSAVSRVLSIMTDLKIKDLDRVKQHDPLRTALGALKSDSNPFLRYQAIYAAQALWCVPDDETPIECFFRHFMDVTGGLIKLSAVIQFDFNGFAGGAKDIQKSVKDMYEFVKSGIEDIPALMEDGKELGGFLRAMVGSGRVHPWYMSLQGAEVLVRTGRFADLRVWVWEAPSQGSYLFQWGICQLLGEIAVDPSWDKDTRCQATLFLGEIFRKSTHHNVKKWIVTILDYISKISTLEIASDHEREAIKAVAVNVGDHLRTNGDETYSFPYLLGRQLPLPGASSILRKVNRTADLEPALLKIKSAVGERGPELYIPLMSKAGLQNPGNKLDPLEVRITTFLGSKRQIMLILGDSGAGKSTFNRHLERRLWRDYQPGGPIPLFIDLMTMGNLDENDVLAKTFALQGFKDNQIQELKEYRQIIVICDGYDECRQWVNLHTRLKVEGWKSFQVVVTCRSQHLTSNYRNYFVPRRDANQTLSQVSALYEEAAIVPFSQDQIEACIEQFRETEEAREIFKGRTIWSKEEYMSRLFKLLELVKNPFMLNLALITLPNIAGNDLGTSRVKMTRFRLYEEFANQHFEKELSRLSDQRSKMLLDDERAFRRIEDEFNLHGIYFSMRLAHSIFEEGGGKNYIEYSAADSRGWKSRFFGPGVRDDTKLLRQSSQVVTFTIQEPNNRSNGRGIASHRSVYSFSHRSILEFYYACRLCDYIQDPSSDRDDSESKQYPDLASCLSSNTDPSLLSDHPLNQRSIISESSVVHFLAEQAAVNTTFKDQLQSIIDLSKTDKSVAVAAANAITILVLSGVQFNGADLRGIQVPGADLSGGHFDSAQLGCANLTGANLSRAWLRQADFCQANMSGVQFGEKPSITKSGLTAMALSPNGANIALGFENGEVKVLDTADWSTRHTLRGHTYRVSHLAFSSSGLQIASGSKDTTIRIWDWQQISAPSRVLTGHSSEVNGVAFSPNGRLLSSVSDDMSVRVWDLELDSVICVFESHEDEAWCTAWSLDGQQVASGGKDGAVYLWQPAYGELERQLWHGLEHVCSVVYAPDGQRLIAAVGNDILIWDLFAGGDPIVLEGHTSGVRAVSFSPNEQWMASAGLDEVVGIWNGRTGAPISKLHGSDPGCVIGVVFWNDQEVISLDLRGTLRFWELSGGTAQSDILGVVVGPMAEGHRDFVEKVTYSWDGKKLFSGGRDKCLREWNTETGESRVVMPTKTNILCIALSPESENRQIALAALDEAPIIFEQAEGSDDISDTGSLGDYSVVVIAYSPCGRWIASGAANGVLALLDRQETEAKERLLVEHTCCISGIEFSPDGELFISWSNWRKDPSIRVWQSKSGVCINVIDRLVESLVFSPCGTMVAWSASVETDEDGQNAVEVAPDIHLTNLQSWQRDIQMLQGHEDLVYSMAWTSEWIVSGSNDRTIRLWKEHTDSKTGSTSWSCAAILNDIAVYTLAWNPVASPLEFVTGCQDSSVCVWTVMESGRKEIGDGNPWRATIQLKWGSIDRLETRGATITDAVGLDKLQKKLLRQRGSIDDASSDDQDDEDKEEDKEEALVQRFRVAQATDIASNEKQETDYQDEDELQEEDEVLIRKFR